MSISQLFTRNEYKLEAKELKVDQLTSSGDLTVEGNSEVKGNSLSSSYDTTLKYDQQVPIGGAFAGQTCQLQFQNYGEFTMMDIGEFLNKSCVDTEDGRAIFPAGTIPLAFRPSKNALFPVLCQRAGSVYAGSLLLFADGGISIQCSSLSTLVTQAGDPPVQTGGVQIKVKWNAINVNNNGWYNQSIMYWRAQLPSNIENRPPVQPSELVSHPE